MKLDVEKNIRFVFLKEKIDQKQSYYEGRFWTLSEVFNFSDGSVKDKILSEMKIASSKIDYFRNLSLNLVSTACAGGYVF